MQELKEGEKKEAAKILITFIHELNTLHDADAHKDYRDKQITDDAYFLLITNVRFIQKKLPRIDDDDNSHHDGGKNNH